MWFHPHPHGRTAEQIYRGLAGLFIIDDPSADPGGLPDSYGVDDIPLIVQDKSFTPTGELDFAAGETTAVGFVGDTIVVNGAIGAYLDAAHERIRLRLLNASTARVYRFAMADDRPFSVIASDGGLLAEPVTTTSVQLSPAERAEIVVDLRPGETTALVSHTPDLGARVDAARIFGGGTFDVLQIRAADQLEPAPDLPGTTATLPAADRGSASGARSFVLGGRIINGRLMDMGRIDEVVTVDTTEVWSVTNQSSLPHNFHVHDGQFRVLSMDGSPPPGELAGWKDTVYVAPTTTVEMLVRFETYTDPSFPYMYHCHLTVHEDQGMMGQFVVVEPGTDPSAGVSSDGRDALRRRLADRADASRRLRRLSRGGSSALGGPPTSPRAPAARRVAPACDAPRPPQRSTVRRRTSGRRGRWRPARSSSSGCGSPGSSARSTPPPADRRWWPPRPGCRAG